MGFWNSLVDGVEKVGHFISETVHEGFNDIENMGKSAENYINSAKDETFNTANHIIGAGEKLGEKVLQTGEDISGKFTSVISTPLILIAGGLALFMISGNMSKAIDVGGRLGESALKNPAIMM